MSFGNVMKDIGHGLAKTGEVIAEAAASAPPPQTEVIEVQEPIPGPFDMYRDREVIVERPEMPVHVVPAGPLHVPLPDHLKQRG